MVATSRFIEFEVYAPDGRNLGEAMGQRRLITRKARWHDAGALRTTTARCRARAFEPTQWMTIHRLPDTEVLR